MFEGVQQSWVVLGGERLELLWQRQQVVANLRERERVEKYFIKLN